MASRDAWWGLAYLTVFGSLVGFTAFAYCINELPASTVGTYAYVNPIVAVLLGYFLGNEILEPRIWLATAIIIGAVAFINNKSKPQVKQEAKEVVNEDGQQKMSSKGTSHSE